MSFDLVDQGPRPSLFLMRALLMSVGRLRKKLELELGFALVRLIGYLLLGVGDFLV